MSENQAEREGSNQGRYFTLITSKQIFEWIIVRSMRASEGDKA